MTGKGTHFAYDMQRKNLKNFQTDGETNKTEEDDQEKQMTSGGPPIDAKSKGEARTVENSQQMTDYI